MKRTRKPNETSLAEKLDHLFRVVHPVGSEYTYEQVAEGVAERGITTISGAYAWQLRHGVRDNPSMRLLRGLADFFGVPAAYFFDEEVAAKVDVQLELLANLRDAGVQHIATRSLDVSPDISPAGRQVIADMIDLIHRKEGLDRKPDGD